LYNIFYSGESMGRRRRGEKYYRVRLSDEDIRVLLGIIRAYLDFELYPHKKWKRYAELLYNKFLKVEYWSYQGSLRYTDKILKSR